MRRPRARAGSGARLASEWRRSALPERFWTHAGASLPGNRHGSSCDGGHSAIAVRSRIGVTKTRLRHPAQCLKPSHFLRRLQPFPHESPVRGGSNPLTHSMVIAYVRASQHERSRVCEHTPTSSDRCRVVVGSSRSPNGNETMRYTPIAPARSARCWCI